MNKKSPTFGENLRIAFVGDVNNNFFSFTRYMRDLGADAHLFIFGNVNRRWRPEADTYAIDPWKPYIHDFIAANNSKHILTRSPSAIRRQLRPFNILVGTGIVPAILSRAKMKLDLFFPYSMGIEGLNRKPRHSYKAFIDLIRIYYQKKGVKNCRYVFNPPGDIQTNRVLKQLGAKTIQYTTIPMVYNREPNSILIDDPVVIKAIEQFKASDFLVSSHVRHNWKQHIKTGRTYSFSKGTDILVKGFAMFHRNSISRNPKLVFLDYGEDVDSTKSLINELGMSTFVIWLPKAFRKQIMQILRHIDVVGGEFYEGPPTFGVFLETLATGKPLLNYMGISRDEYLASTGSPLPPVLHCATPEDVCRNLLELEANPSLREQIGAAGRAWFDEYAGIGLARRYKDLFEKVANVKKSNRH